MYDVNFFDLRPIDWLFDKRIFFIRDFCFVLFNFYDDRARSEYVNGVVLIKAAL